MDLSIFKGMKLVVATPMYRPEVCAAYKRSYAALMRYLMAANIPVSEHESHDTYLPRARNFLAMAMLETEATHHLLLDADMGFDHNDVMRMLYHSASDEKYEVIGAAYPLKCLDWDRIKACVLAKPDIDVDKLRHAALREWTFKGITPGAHDIGMPVELTEVNPHVGTGMMVIRRKVYETMKDKVPSYIDRPSEKRCWRMFHADVDPLDDRWIGEDVWFCREWKKMGGRIWLAPWVKTEHWGPYCYSGDLSKVVDAGMEVPG